MSTSSTVAPHASRRSAAEVTMSRVATLKTSRPFIRTQCSPFATVCALDDRRARAVAEEDARRAVGPVHDLRERLRPHDEGLLRDAARDDAVRLGEPVEEARAGG